MLAIVLLKLKLSAQSRHYTVIPAHTAVRSDQVDKFDINTFNNGRFQKEKFYKSNVEI